MEKGKEQTDQSANELLFAGTAFGGVGTMGALATGAVCPICIVATPLLLGIGLVKKLWSGRKSPSCALPEEGKN